MKKFLLKKKTFGIEIHTDNYNNHYKKIKIISIKQYQLEIKFCNLLKKIIKSICIFDESNINETPIVKAIEQFFATLKNRKKIYDRIIEMSLLRNIPINISVE